MPPIREHQTSPSSQHQPNANSSGEEDHSSTKSDKSNSLLLTDKDRNRRGKRSPSINTRASRVGVTNFINVIKSLHPGESINYFPITKETLQDYIDSKKKNLIKAGSLEQYLQHIQAYNIALGFGWDGHVFGPIIKKALDELRNYEDEISLKTGNVLIISSNQPQQPTLVNSAISQHSNPFSNSLDSNFTSSTDANVKTENLFTIDEDDTMNDDFDGVLSIDGQEKNSKKMIHVVCFDASSIPFAVLDQCGKVFLDNLNSPNPTENLRQLYSNVSSADFPKSWGDVDLKLHYRVEAREDANHFSLNGISSFVQFWSKFNEFGNEVQLIVYRKIPIVNPSQRRFHASPEPIFPSRPSSPQPIQSSLESHVLKSVTVRSKAKIYKQKIAVSDTTTFSSLLSFAIKVPPPVGKQFVIRAADGVLEYMPDDLVREVITGIEHTEIIICLEDAGPVNFDYF
ncbi:7066_t:CDS:2 [Funneliformis geosporum]|uniref:1722_t:CDS:1 n=1 Tax=Funneliformis geosporum TaxID=1117311 RepID=A0A9W4WTJ3_9GLOM|nr:1722_t:CDS:2 [Funneliformis geosporum]CAI2178698.1 7066_t:CDS:2 [Funneliformis geosporum]